MQLMPATAKSTAGKLGLGYSLGSLTGDPDYNVTLGAAYLQSVIEGFDGHYHLAMADYNAGPSRVDHGLARQGPPAAPGGAVVDWSESITATEVRHYTQRVLNASAESSERTER